MGGEGRGAEAKPAAWGVALPNRAGPGLSTTRAAARQFWPPPRGGGMRPADSEACPRGGDPALASQRPRDGTVASRDLDAPDSAGPARARRPLQATGPAGRQEPGRRTA